MAVSVREILGTIATLLSTELNSLASNAQVVSSVIATTGVYNNTAGSGSSATTGDGYERGYVQFVPGGVFSGAPAVNSSIDLYFLKSVDGGTTFEAGSTSQLPARNPDVSIGLNSGSTAVADNTLSKAVFLPGCPFKILAKNNGSGQALAPSGNTIKLIPATDQVS